MYLLARSCIRFREEPNVFEAVNAGQVMCTETVTDRLFRESLLISGCEAEFRCAFLK